MNSDFFLTFFILIYLIQYSGKNETPITTEIEKNYIFKNEGRGCMDFLVWKLIVHP